MRPERLLALPPFDLKMMTIKVKSLGAQWSEIACNGRKNSAPDRRYAG
jgi:hypothetical protein